MKKLISLISTILICSCLCSISSMAAAARTGNNLTTITVDASDNESGNLMYSIDSDEPSAFGSSNEFVVESGSSHTVYVKDAAGNISGQVITAPIEKVGIEVTIGQDGTDSAIASASAGNASEPAVEAGGGSVSEKSVTDGSSSSEKIFYTITTPNENVFYMVVDNTRTTDNVYLLTQATEEDLRALSKGADAKDADVKETLFSSNTDAVKEATNIDESSKTEVPAEVGTNKNQKKSDLPLIIVIALIVGGIYYYLKVYKPKKAAEMDLDDAMDMDDFEAEESEGEELFFEEAEAKERLLRKITCDAVGKEKEDFRLRETDAEEDDGIESEEMELIDKSLDDFEQEIEAETREEEKC